MKRREKNLDGGRERHVARGKVLQSFCSCKEERRKSGKKKKVITRIKEK